jgi:hypothetical protein
MNDNDGWETVGAGRRWGSGSGSGSGGGGGAAAAGASAGGSRSWGGAWGSSSTAFGSGSGSGRSSGREMPAAFGGGDPHKAERRAAAEAQAAREAADARVKKAAEEKERKRIADATNFTSEEFYPSLGGGGGGVSAKPKPAMNFSKVVSEMAEREEIRRVEEEREAAAAAAAVAQARSDAAVARRHVYGYRGVQHFAYAGDDADEEAPVDDYPEDSDYEEEPPAAEEEDTGEFNADIGSSRRRGDKGIW